MDIDYYRNDFFFIQNELGCDRKVNGDSELDLSLHRIPEPSLITTPETPQGLLERGRSE